MNYPEQFELVVTQEDINASIEQRQSDPYKYRPSQHCPVSRAASRIIGAPATSAGNISFIGDRNVYTCRSLQIDAWQNRFDADLPVAPFSIMMYRR